MTPKTVQEWLRWQEQLHSSEIDLGLDRCRPVFDRLLESAPGFLTVSVAGTNGKGSCAAFLENYCLSAGLRTGQYSSPHLLRYNERIRINGQEIDDASLCAAFQRVEDARENTSLTYFEFGTLAAIDCFVHQNVDIAILEVGLGGRLDAVNLLDADVAIITSIALDHQDWLGADREAIAREKAGIFRAGKAAICGDRHAPASLMTTARETGANLLRLGCEFEIEQTSDSFRWSGLKSGLTLDELPMPRYLAGTAQLENLASAIMALDRLSASFANRGLQRDGINRIALLDALQNTRLPGRFQIIPGDVEWILDVAHNPAAARNLAACLQELPASGKMTLVLGMLSDKDVHGVVSELGGLIDEIVLCSLPGPRGLSAADLTARIPGADDLDLKQAGSVHNGCDLAMSGSASGDRIVVTGSFLTVAAALELLDYPAQCDAEIRPGRAESA